jgi:hypothetical protein
MEPPKESELIIDENASLTKINPEGFFPDLDS